MEAVPHDLTVAMDDDEHHPDASSSTSAPLHPAVVPMEVFEDEGEEVSSQRSSKRPRTKGQIDLIAALDMECNNEFQDLSVWEGLMDGWRAEDIKQGDLRELDGIIARGVLD